MSKPTSISPASTLTAKFALHHQKGIFTQPTDKHPLQNLEYHFALQHLGLKSEAFIAQWQSANLESSGAFDAVWPSANSPCFQPLVKQYYQDERGSRPETVMRFDLPIGHYEPEKQLHLPLKKKGACEPETWTTYVHRAGT